jgi:Protein of unknown function (DUF2971)
VADNNPPDQKWKRDIENPAFPQLSRDVRVWRYTDLGKFLWTLSKSALYLRRADLLPDRFEGSAPLREHDRLVEAAQEFAASKGWQPFDHAEVLRQLLPQHRRYRLALNRASHVNCWRHGDESEAMWRLYCGQKEGVAMVTSFGRLNDSISDPAVRLAAVRYIDYSTEVFPDANWLQAITHKRKAFAHEQEVRIVRWLLNEWQRQLAENAPDAPAGMEMAWDASHVLESVVVSPYSDEWYFETVRAVVERFSPKLASKLVWSDLRRDPVF